MKTEKKQNTGENVEKEVTLQEETAEHKNVVPESASDEAKPESADRTSSKNSRRRNRKKATEFSENIQKITTDSKSDEPTEKTSATKAQTGKKKSSGTFGRRFGASLVAFFGTVLMIGETFSVVTYGIPYLVLFMFQSVGIGVEEGLTLAEFSVSDAVVMASLWILPCLCMIILIALAQWRLLCFVFRHMANLCKRVFRREKKVQ